MQKVFENNIKKVRKFVDDDTWEYFRATKFFPNFVNCLVAQLMIIEQLYSDKTQIDNEMKSAIKRAIEIYTLKFILVRHEEV